MTDHEPRDELQMLKNDLLMGAVLDGCCHMAEALARRGANPDQSGRPITTAAHRGRTDIVDVLVRYGARIDRLDHLALRTAAAGGHLETVNYLLSVGADVTAEKHEAYRQARNHGHREVAAVLRRAGSFDFYDPHDRPDDPSLSRDWTKAGLRRAELERSGLSGDDLEAKLREKPASPQRRAQVIRLGEAVGRHNPPNRPE